MAQITQRSIAEKLGISQQAVAFGLSDKPHSQKQLHPSTRRRVIETAEQMGYVPHHVARSLKEGKTQTIGLVGHFASGLVNERLNALIMESQKGGYKLLLAGRDHGNIEQEKVLIKNLLERRVDGLIILNELYCDTSYYELLRSRDVPLVLLSPLRDPGNLPIVNIDLVKGMREATWHLFDLGHRDIAYAAGSDAIQMPAHRYWGFRDAFEKAGFSIREGRVMDDAIASPETARQFTLRMLQMRPRPTAIMYINDNMALGGIHTILERKLRIPEDISVVGFNDMPYATLTWPTLTTVRQPIEEIAKKTFELLKMQMEGKTGDFSGTIVQSRLVVRESTGPVPV